MAPTRLIDRHAPAGRAEGHCIDRTVLVGDYEEKLAVTDGPFARIGDTELAGPGPVSLPNKSEGLKTTTRVRGHHAEAVYSFLRDAGLEDGVTGKRFGDVPAQADLK